MSLPSFVISGLPADAAEDAKIRVTFRHNRSGIFQLTSAQYLKEIIEVEEAAAEAPIAEQASSSKSDGGATPAPEGEAPAAGHDESSKMDDAEAAPAESSAKSAEDGESKQTMETEAPSPTPVSSEAPPPPKKKKKFSRVALEATATLLGMSNTEVSAARDREATYAARDAAMKETEEKRNELEAYLYSMRERIDGDLKEFVATEQQEKMIEEIDTAESWLYDEGFDEAKAVYQGKLDELRGNAAGVLKRLRESELRPERVKELRAAIEYVLKVVNSTDEAYAHIADDERDKARAQCTNTTDWIGKAEEDQAALPLSTDPTLTVMMIEGRLHDFRAATNPIVNKPKPKPPPAPTPEPEAKKEDAGAETKDGAAENDIEMKDAGEGKEGKDVEMEAGDKDAAEAPAEGLSADNMELD